MKPGLACGLKLRRDEGCGEYKQHSDHKSVSMREKSATELKLMESSC